MASANELLPTPPYMDASYDDYDNPNSMSMASQGVYDFLPEGPKCKCCPYGYHVDVGFVQYAEDAKRGKYLRHLEQIQRYKKKLRQTMEVFYKQHGRYPPMLNPPDLIKGSEADSESLDGSNLGDDGGTADEDTFAVFGTTEHRQNIARGASSKTVHKKATVEKPPTSSASIVRHHTSEKSPLFVEVSTAETQQHQTVSRTPSTECAECHKAMYCSAPVASGDCCACRAYCPQCTSASLTTFLGQQHEALRQVDTHVTEASTSDQLVEITREQLTKIREQMASSLTRLRELEALVKNLPVLEARLNVVLEEKELLKMHLGEREQEAADFRTRFEESLVQISTLESLRAKDEVEFQQKIATLESRIPKPVQLSNASVGNGDVREIYFVQPRLLRNYMTDCDFDIPANVLATLRSRWEAEFKRMEAQRAPLMRSVGVSMTPLTNTAGVDAKPLVQYADVWQSVDMDDEEWHSKELHFSGGTEVLNWFQEQVSSSREQRTIIQALRRAHQFDRSEFKNLIIRLLSKSVRSQSVQVFPSMHSAGVMTDEVDTCHQGVGEDTVDVRVRPKVPCYSVGVGARPAMLSKMVFTDRIFRYDASTNTLPAPMSDVSTWTERQPQTTFCFGVQTDTVRSRDRSILTDNVDIIDRGKMYSTASNTDRQAALNAATNTELLNHMDRSMSTESRRLYETSVCTEPVRTSNKSIDVDLSPPPESEPVSNISNFESSSLIRSKEEKTPSVREKTKTETWEEITYFDRDGKVVRSTGHDCSHASRDSGRSESEVSEISSMSSRTASRSSERQVLKGARSRSSGGESSSSSRRGGSSVEFGGGTVRPGDPLPDFSMDSKTSCSSIKSDIVMEKSSSSLKSSSVSDSVSSGFARSRIPMSHLNPEGELVISTSTESTSLREGSSSSMRSTREVHELLFGSFVHVDRSKSDVKSSDLYTACQTFARWMSDSTTTTSKQMNDAEASIRKFWFRLVGSVTSRHEVVEPYLTAIRELGVSVLSKVVNMADDTGNTGIHYAVSNCNWPLVQSLLNACSVQLERLNRAGYSVLMLAALCDLKSDDQIAIVKRLVAAATNVDLCSSSGAGQTALMLAATHGRLPMVEALLAAGANPNIQDKEGSSALMCASEHGHTEVVRALLANSKTDCNLKDGEGATALSIAMENNHRDISLLIYARENLSKTAAAKGRRPYPQRRHVHISDNTTTFKYK